MLWCIAALVTWIPRSRGRNRCAGALVNRAGNLYVSIARLRAREACTFFLKESCRKAAFSTCLDVQVRLDEA